MSFFLQAISKDLSRWRRDATALLIWISIPFLIGGLLTLLMDGGDARPHGILLVVDQDNSVLSGLVAAAYSQGELGELLSVEKVALDAGTEMIDAGDASGLLVIPSGFGAAFVNQTPITLTLQTNPSQVILPDIIRDVTEVLLDAGFYAQKLFSDEIRKIQAIDSGLEKGDSNADTVAAIAVAVQHKIDNAAPYLFPPGLDVEMAKPQVDEPAKSMAMLFLPGIILMAMMFSANGLAADYWIEREGGTLRRLMFAPGRLYGFVAAKSLAAGLVMASIGGLTLIVGFLYHGIAWDRLLPSLLWIGASGIALFAWFSVLTMIGSTQRAGNLITSMLLFPLLMAGGSFFPLAALPDWIAAIGRHTPNGFVADHLTREITGSSAWSFSLPSWLFVLSLAAAGLALCAWRLKSGFART
jgi:ABC-type multidrug transport system permease subunit